MQSAHISLSASARNAAAAVDAPDEERCAVGWIKAPAEDAAASPDADATEYQLVALTFTGGWYRLALPRLTGRTRKGSSAAPGPFRTASLASGSPPRAPLASRAGSVAGSSASRLDKGKEKEREKDKGKKESRNCTLQEYRRFGRWDGWG